MLVLPVDAIAKPCAFAQDRHRLQPHAFGGAGKADKGLALKIAERDAFLPEQRMLGPAEDTKLLAKQTDRGQVDQGCGQ